MTEPNDIDALAAALRADTTDLEVLARVLMNSLAEALPEGMVVVERDQSLRDRLAGRPGTVRVARVMLGDTALELARGHGGAPVARSVRVVNGVVISHREIGMDEWSRQLADHLAARSNESAAARSALAKLLGQSD